MYLIDFCAIACKPQTPKQLFMNLTFTKMKALAAGALLLSHCTYAQINTPSGATKPFATNTSYAYGIMPTNLPSGGTYGASGDAATAYTAWKTKFVQDCSGGSKRVLYDDNSSTVSEGIAYGMLLAAYAADQATFNGLYKFYKDNMNANKVMNWKYSSCTSRSGDNGATDAELDAAMALLVAEYQWPAATSPYDYKTEAINLIGNIRLHEMDASTHQTLNGDNWSFNANCRNPSYFSPAYYREFSKAETGQSSFWNSAVTTTQSFLLTNRNSTTGLVSNWADQNAAANSCNGNNEYGWDACRNPWRMGVDVLWNGAATATTASNICLKIAAWSNGYGARLKGPLAQNAANPGVGSYKSGAFASYALAVMGSSSTYQSHLNTCYTNIVGIGSGEAYFGNTLRVVNLFVLSGNFWQPDVTVGISETQEESFRTYPNPFTNSVTVEGLSAATNYIITDIAGRVLQSGSTMGVIETPFSAGVYSLAVQTNSGWTKAVKMIKVD